MCVGFYVLVLPESFGGVELKDIRLVEPESFGGVELKDIRLVEIELNSFCNRRCDWCPNYFIDRSIDVDLDREVFRGLIDELAEHGYKNFISFSRYNEPFYKPRLLENSISYVRRMLPDVTIVCNTNGDFSFVGFDIDELTVMDYDKHYKEFLIESDTRKIRGMYLNKINDRGGLLPHVTDPVRTKACYEPQFFVGVDFNGSVVPCCNIRSDIMMHEPFILGDLHDDKLFDILNSDKAVQFRTDVGNCVFPYVCKHCSKTGGRYTMEVGCIENPVG